MQNEIESSRQVTHLSIDQLKTKLDEVIKEAFIRSGNYSPEPSIIGYLAPEIAKLIKDKFKYLYYGDIEKTFARGQAGDFNATYSKEKLTYNNISYWFHKLNDERISAKMVNRDQDHEKKKGSDKESIMTGVAITASGRGWAFLCKLEADFIGEYKGDEYRFKLQCIDKLKKNTPFLGAEIEKAEQTHIEALKLKNSRDILAKKRGIDMGLVSDLVYKDIREMFKV